jgi:hypothetical protein
VLRAVPKWIPPPTEIAKINVDTAVSRSEDQGAAAAFCQDNNGNYLGTSAIVIQGITDQATLESIACREALALAEDCQTVVKEIKTGSRGRYGSIIEEIKSRSTLLHECSFVFEQRAFNFEAHNLGRFATTLGIGRHLWLGIPYDMKTFLLMNKI